MSAIFQPTNLRAAAVQRVCVILTCFNRKEKTLACFAAIQANILPQDVELIAVVVDDGSTDGTSAEMRERYPWAHIEHSAGNLYWCRGMHQAFNIAKRSSPDFYLWLNDDTMLQADALVRLITTERTLRIAAGRPVVVVGSTVDEETRVLTYGGCARLSGLKRMRFEHIQPTNAAQRCATMNGNVVLISKEASDVVGNLDPLFEHAMGDTDYALRANKLGVAVWVAPGVHGVCSSNPLAGTYMDANLPLRRRWSLMMHRKGLPWRSWLALTSRHAGPAWPLYFIWPYLSLILGLYKSRPNK